MAKPLAPEVRSQFAKRLKEMRTQRGFRSCALLRQVAGHRGEPLHALRARRGRAQPHAHSQDVRDAARVAQRAAGFCGPRRLCASRRLRRGAAARRRRGRRAMPATRHAVSSLAWRLASEAVAIRSKHRAEPEGVERSARDACARPARCFSSCRPIRSARWPRSSRDDALKDARRRAQGRSSPS